MICFCAWFLAVFSVRFWFFKTQKVLGNSILLGWGFGIVGRFQFSVFLFHLSATVLCEFLFAWDMMLASRPNVALVPFLQQFLCACDRNRPWPDALVVLFSTSSVVKLVTLIQKGFPATGSIPHINKWSGSHGFDDSLTVLFIKIPGPYEGGKPDATFSFKDEDFVKVATGKMNPQIAFIRYGYPSFRVPYLLIIYPCSSFSCFR